MANLKGSGRILVVEDDDMIRDFVVKALRRRGYEVDSAADGEKAAELFQQRPESVGLLLTDLTMPRKSGQELIEEVKAARPGLPIVVMSGYGEEDNKDLRGVFVIPKPFQIEHLLTAVESQLRRSSTLEMG